MYTAKTLHVRDKLLDTNRNNVQRWRMRRQFSISLIACYNHGTRLCHEEIRPGHARMGV
jgi:hypothetical protein